MLTVGIASDLSNHTTSLWFGYLVMLVALSLIFVGVKRYRDSQCGGVINFGPAFVLGLAIAAVAALVYALVWESYLQFRAMTSWPITPSRTWTACVPTARPRPRLRRKPPK